MIPVIEDYLQDILETQFSFLKENPEYIDRVLKMNTGRRENLKQHLMRKKTISVIKGYPRTPAELPCICILLSNENETQEGLGDYSDEEHIDVQEYTEEALVTDYPNGKYPYPYIEVSKKPVQNIISLTHNDFGVPLEDYAIVDSKKGIVAIFSDIVEQDDSVTVNFIYNKLSSEDLRVKYEANFRLEAWASNADLVVELYHLIKWALLESRDDLSYNKGIFRQKLGGSDYEPAPKYFPEFVYRRSLQFWCEFSVSIPLRDVPYIQNIECNTEVNTKLDKEV